MPDFTISNNTLGGSTGYTASGNCYQQAKEEVSNILASGCQPNIDADTFRNIEYVAGPFSYEEKQKLGF